MTPEETKKILAERKEQDKVMEHFVNGGEVECSYKGRKGWKLTIDPMWEWDDFDYRIKSFKPEVGKWYEFPRGGKYKCIAFEFGYYYFSTLIDDEPDVVIYQDACDFSNFKEVQHEVDKLLEPTSEIVPIGTKVRVTKSKYGHNFKIGEVVNVIKIDVVAPDYLCSNTHHYWWLSREEFEPV